MPYKKGTREYTLERSKGSVNATIKLIWEHISQDIEGNKIKGYVKIGSGTKYIKAISKLLAHSIGKIKALEVVEEREPIDIKIDFFTSTEKED